MLSFIVHTGLYASNTFANTHSGRKVSSSSGKVSCPIMHNKFTLQANCPENVYAYAYIDV
jgi:hypothetical protein